MTESFASPTGIKPSSTAFLSQSLNSSRNFTASKSYMQDNQALSSQSPSPKIKIIQNNSVFI